MAKAKNRELVILKSTQSSSTYYVTATKGKKLKLMKFDSKLHKYVEFTQQKLR